MDIVYVRDLKLDARIGIYEWEKRILQKIRIDLEMGWDNRIPAASDAINDTLNYKTAAKLVMQLVEGTHYELVERLAETIATTLMRELNVPWIQVTVGKPGAVRGSSEVGVKIERGNRQWQAST
ncbi:MAG: dihydroneopterin aldolase [Pseudomonadota bacterium]|jgi:dihydroneopterin aldolase|uniref:7,8-dihydroneopterin aldolase n=1 Tax=Thiothrix fructosivorans TaxID=111770 RepID=A0A8B0SE86_9GAMM|nr:dihydroneopterin aldolase [Thiothrix fructosivorans]MBO0614678.1 dihydroneopterin aldolase [Thiothrix fructosivorans]QTX09501.1 dihydroneopterin aldolase [Thiothrix fructosivorans]